MARLVVLYNDLDPRTEASVKRFAPEAGLEPEWVDTSPSMQSYADALEERWDGTQDLIVVEQDKEVHGQCFPSLLSCTTSLWCGYTSWLYPVPHTVLGIGSFGCTKFSPLVQKMLPVSLFRGGGQKGIDRRFADLLQKLGGGCCLHGHVVHHHVYEPRPLALRQYVESLRAQGLVAPAAYPEPLDPGLLPGSYRLPGR